MINKHMIQNTPENNTNKPKEEDEMRRPDEISGVFVQGHIKIFDPTTKVVFINKRS